MSAKCVVYDKIVSNKINFVNGICYMLWRGMWQGTQNYVYVGKEMCLCVILKTVSIVFWISEF